MDLRRLKRRLDRLTRMRDDLYTEHKGNEQNYTYHGGFSLGYLIGQISILEDVIDDLEEEGEKECL